MSLSHFRRPFDVIKHPSLEPEVKRAILASWASDASAVKHRPGLRRIPGGRRTVPIDDVLTAIKSLDGE